MKIEFKWIQITCLFFFVQTLFIEKVIIKLKCYIGSDREEDEKQMARKESAKEMNKSMKMKQKSKERRNNGKKRLKGMKRISNIGEERKKVTEIKEENNKK